jgi:hypothetical protein
MVSQDGTVISIFMTVIGESRILPETLDVSWAIGNEAELDPSNISVIPEPS